MKWCKPHWDELKAAIEKRGMGNLIAKSTEAMIERVKEEMAQQQPSDDTFDPLMAAFWSINTRALDLGGLYLMMDDVCPLCELNLHTGPEILKELNGVVPSTQWIDGCCDSFLEYARSKSLLAPTTDSPRPS